MRLAGISCTIALLAGLATPVLGFNARNGMVAVQSGPTEITVDFDARRNQTDYWCAAGDFAQSVMDLPGETRIWRASPKPRKAGQGIIFTLNRDLRAEGAGLSHFGAGPDDGSVSLGMAVGNYCRRPVPVWRD